MTKPSTTRSRCARCSISTTAGSTPAACTRCPKRRTAKAESAWRRRATCAVDAGHILSLQRQLPDPAASRIENSVPDRRRDSHDRRFARARAHQVLTVEPHALDRRCIAEARQAIAREPVVQNLSVAEFDALEQRAAKPHYDRALYLVFQMLGIDDGAAFERDYRAEYLGGAGVRVDRDFGAGRHIAAFFESRADPESVARRLLARAPAELVGRRENHRAQPLVGRVLQTEIERVHLYRVRQLIHPRFAHEVIRRRRQTAVGALAQRGLGPVELLLLPGDVIGRLQPARPRVVIVELPRGDRSIRRGVSADLDQPARPKVPPRHLVLARPVALPRLADAFGDPRRLARRIALVLPAVAGTGVRHDHVHVLLRHAEFARQIAAHAEWTLRAGPHCELVAFPLRHGRARLERHVRDVGHGIRRQPRARSAIAILLEIFEDALAVGLGRYRLPLGLPSRDRLLRHIRRPRP